jgi:hypothetical protein
MTVQPDPMDNPTLLHMMNSTLDALPLNPKFEREDRQAQFEAASVALGTLGPRDGNEAMIVARAVSAHHAAMECFRRAALPDVSDVMMLRLYARAAALSRLSSQLIQALERRQAATTRPARPTGQPAAVGARPAAAAGTQHPLPSERQPAPPAMPHERQPAPQPSPAMPHERQPAPQPSPAPAVDPGRHHAASGPAVGGDARPGPFSPQVAGGALHPMPSERQAVSQPPAAPCPMA